MDRRASLGMSMAELVMARIGHLSGALCLFFVLPLLPYLLGITVVSKVADALKGAETTNYRPQYRPSWAE